MNYDVTQLQPIMTSRHCNELDLLKYEIVSKKLIKKESNEEKCIYKDNILFC